MGTTEIKQRISDYHVFLSLVYELSKNNRPFLDGFRSLDEFRSALDSVQEFLECAYRRDIFERRNALELNLKQFVSAFEMLIPKNKGVREIAQDFRHLESELDIWRFGIPLSWLIERFDVSRLLYTKDLPRHARVGIGIHAGRVAVEEATLLEDTFFLLIRAQKLFDEMKSFHKNLDYKKLNSLKSSLCIYSRLGVVTSAAFVEAFVNSVGWNETEIQTNLPEKDKEQLHGTLNGRYLSLEWKIERFPGIIRPDKARPIIISDEKQRREPFISFLRETKPLRDATMHYAPGKYSIILPPNEWLQLVEASAKNAVNVAREFWSACYPEREQPMYLASLYYEGLQKMALDRLAEGGERP